MAESAQQSLIREHFVNERGWWLGRNNVGVLPDRRGIPVRYGLGNDSEKVNRVLKSGDLIGWEPVLITPSMVGEVIAAFRSIEVKDKDWKPPRPGPLLTAGGKLTAYGHFVGQQNWADLVNAHGGQAGFMRDPGEGFLPSPNERRVEDGPQQRRRYRQDV